MQHLRSLKESQPLWPASRALADKHGDTGEENVSRLLLSALNWYDRAHSAMALTLQPDSNGNTKPIIYLEKHGRSQFLCREVPETPVHLDCPHWWRLWAHNANTWDLSFITLLPLPKKELKCGVLIVDPPSLHKLLNVMTSALSTPGLYRHWVEKESWASPSEPQEIPKVKIWMNVPYPCQRKRQLEITHITITMENF